MKLMNRNISFSLVILLLSCFLLGAGQQQTEPVDYWKKKVLEAHGGIDAIKQISTLAFSGKIITRGDSGTVMLTLSRPGQLRATMKYTKRCEDRILSEKSGWRDFGNGFEKAVGHSLEAMLFQYDHLNLPMGFFDKRFEISYHELKVGEKGVPVLEFLSREEPPMAVVIDPETGLIRQVTGKITMGGHEVQMGVGYGDYRRVEGVMLPHRIVNYVNGMAIADSRYENVRINSPLNPETFDISASHCRTTVPDK